MRSLIASASSWPLSLASGSISTCPRVPIASGFGEMLSLDGLSLCGGTSLPRLGSPFVGFSLSTLSFGGLLVSRGASAVRLNRTASGHLAKLSRLLTTTLITPAARGASDEGDKQQHHHGADSNDDDRSGTHGFLLKLVYWCSWPRADVNVNTPSL